MYLGVREMELRKVVFDATYQPGEIDISGRQIRQIEPLVVKGTAELLGATEEIRVRGHLSVTLQAECDRCLETVTTPVDKDFDLFYRPAEHRVIGDEVEIHEGDTEIAFYEGGGLDLKEILREQVLLHLPMRQVCSEACKGICPECGQNRNLSECDCRRETTDDRWLKLKNLTK